jgi:hypothetical protein
MNAVDSNLADSRRIRERLFQPLWIGVATVALLVGAIACFVEVIGARDMTATAMGETSYRVQMYVQQNGRLPNDLSVIPTRDGYANRVTDGWNRPLLYSVEGNIFHLKSFGRDGVTGGTGDDADIVESYRVENDRLKRDVSK